MELKIAVLGNQPLIKTRAMVATLRSTVETPPITTLVQPITPTRLD